MNVEGDVLHGATVVKNEMIGAIGAGHPVAGAGPLGGVNAHVNPGWAHDPAGSRYPSLFSGLIAARLSCLYTNEQ